MGFVYAETAKPDLGGEFFITQLKHVQYGMHLYVVLMTGALLQRSSTTYPGIIAGSALVVTIWARDKFKREFRWEFLEFNELDEVLDEEHKRMRASKMANYKQPELPQPQEPQEGPAASVKGKGSSKGASTPPPGVAGTRRPRIEKTC